MGPSTYLKTPKTKCSYPKFASLSFRDMNSVQLVNSIDIFGNL